MPSLLRNTMLLGSAVLAIWLALGGPARAADTKSQITMLINERGSVEVVDRWSGLKQPDGRFDYFSAAREVGTVPVKVQDGGFTLSFRTKSYLRYEDGRYIFVTPDFFYEGGPLDVDLSLTFPPNLKLVSSNPEPDYEGEGVLRWNLKDCVHTIVFAHFDRTGPFVDPLRSGPDYQVDPRLLGVLTQEELPGSGDEVLKELENVIAVAKASESTDPDFIHVLDKLLAKFYYIMDSNGLLLDYSPPGMTRKEADKSAEKAKEPEPEPEPPAEQKHKPKASAGP